MKLTSLNIIIKARRINLAQVRRLENMGFTVSIICK